MHKITKKIAEAAVLILEEWLQNVVLPWKSKVPTVGCSCGGPEQLYRGRAALSVYGRLFHFRRPSNFRVS